jgi:hypothetical protein
MTIGNRNNLPVHPDYLEDLGVRPTKLRVYRTEELPEDEVRIWWLDGCAVVDGKFAYTEELEYHTSWASAIAALPRFWEEVT